MARKKRILHLTLKKKWFDLVASGKKICEYREGKEYWRKRLLNDDGSNREFDEIHFRNGYGKDKPLCVVEWKGLGTWCFADKGPQVAYGPHGEEYHHGDFQIDLGKVLHLDNIQQD